MRTDRAKGRASALAGDRQVDGDAAPEDRYASALEAQQAFEEILRLGGFDDAEQLLRDFFAEPKEHEKTHLPAVLGSLLRNAQAVGNEGNQPLALSLAQRALALEPDNAQAKHLCARFASPERRPLGLAITLPVVATALVGGFLFG